MREKARQRDADTMPYSIKRELRVVFSKNRSPHGGSTGRGGSGLGSAASRSRGWENNSRKWVMHRAVRGESILP
jgi:hypothetical protein